MDRIIGYTGIFSALSAMAGLVPLGARLAGIPVSNEVLVYPFVPLALWSVGMLFLAGRARK